MTIILNRLNTARFKYIHVSNKIKHCDGWLDFNVINYPTDLNGKVYT